MRARPLLDELEVRDRVARRVGVEREPGRVAAVAADRGLDAPGRDAGRRVRARGRCARARARRTSSTSASCASSERATTSSPEVSRSRRWTMPGPLRSSPPATMPASASTSVPVARPAPGWTTRPAGLSTTSECSSSHDDRGRRPPSAAAQAPRPAGARPARRLRAGSSRAPASVDQCARVHSPCGGRTRAERPARKRSSLSPRPRPGRPAPMGHLFQPPQSRHTSGAVPG